MQIVYMKCEEERQQRSCLGTDSRKLGVVGLKPVLLALNLTLNSNVAPNYKYMFGPHWGPLTHLLNLILLNWMNTLYEVI